MRVLVVDDEYDIRYLVQAALEHCEVLTAADGPSALALLRHAKIDAVLLDVMMPGIDGWQVCRTIKNHPDFASTKVVMVTAKGGFEDKFEGMRSGADDYVVKPVDLNELAEKVRRNLEARRKA